MNFEDNPKLYAIRHSLAHVLAQAVVEKYPKARLGFGPPTREGFYYDFDFQGEAPAEADLKDLEKRMRKIIQSDQVFEKVSGNFEDALKIIDSVKEPYKAENIKNLHDRGVLEFSFYKNGSFQDLCEGPHVEKTRDLPADSFKLDRIAGAYWLGDQKRPMLTRIYALAFENKQDLHDYKMRREKAAAFDHKKLGKELDIYQIEELVGKGLPLWLPNGTVIRDCIQRFAEEKEFEYGYKRVSTPHITKKELYVQSEHVPAYLDSMFPPMVVEEEGDKTEYYLKPMNCPHHHLIYGARPHSYRDLPIRLAEYGHVYRYEQSGELSGLIRVRCMCMNDAHIYLRRDQFESEFRKTIELYQEFYSTFKLKDYTYRLSIRGKDNAEKFKGDPAMWDEGEALLAKVMDEMKLPYFVGEGEGAFYGPKIDIQFRNVMGREETVSTIQVDFLSPKNFDLKYTDEKGDARSPIIIHRSPLSTHERFISFLLEYYGGAFPTWCAPEQVCIIPVHTDSLKYCEDLKKRLFSQKVRVYIDDSDNSFNKKIRTNLKKKVPILLIIGEEEVKNNKVTIRRYGVEKQDTLPADKFIDKLRIEIRDRTMEREPIGSLI